KHVRNSGAAGKSMGNAKERLGQLDSRGAVPPERNALEQLSQSQQQMQSAMQQMAQRGQLGNMPVTRFFRGGRFLPYGSLTPLPGTPQFPSSTSKADSPDWRRKNSACPAKRIIKRRAISAKRSSSLSNR